MAAYALTRAGARVVVLEAGGPWDNMSSDSAMLNWPYDTQRRGASTTERPFGEFDACIGGWEIAGEPYSRAAGTKFSWWRARMVGGRTNHWGRISLRFGPDDFRRGDLDGLSPNWPIGYGDISPYYDQLDRLVGLFGSNEGMPNQPDGIFLPPPRPRAYELLVMNAGEEAERHLHPGAALGDHPAPQWPVGVSLLRAVQPRLRGERELLQHQCAARARDGDRQADTGDARDGARGDAGCRRAGRTGSTTSTPGAGPSRVCVPGWWCWRRVPASRPGCCSTRSRRSSPTDWPTRAAQVGKDLTDTTGTDVAGFIPKLVGRTIYNEDGVGGGHVYMPWWLDNAKLDFPRGYHIEVWGGLDQPGAGFMGGIENYPNGGGWGARLKNDYRRYYGTTVGFSGRGEMIPNKGTYCEIDPNLKDKYGIPALKFHWQWTDYEYNQVRHMQQTFRALVEAMGGEVFDPMPMKEEGYGIADGGTIIHELGGTKMGADPATSVLNANCQAHDVPNLFVADGGPFVSQADKNPTWTIMALELADERLYRGTARRRGPVTDETASTAARP